MIEMIFDIIGALTFIALFVLASTFAVGYFIGLMIF